MGRLCFLCLTESFKINTKTSFSLMSELSGNIGLVFPWKSLFTDLLRIKRWKVRFYRIPAFSKLANRTKMVITQSTHSMYILELLIIQQFNNWPDFTVNQLVLWKQCNWIWFYRWPLPNTVSKFSKQIYRIQKPPLLVFLNRRRFEVLCGRTPKPPQTCPCRVEVHLLSNLSNGGEFWLIILFSEGFRTRIPSCLK